MLPPNDYNYPVVQYLGSIFSLQDLRDEEVVQNSLLLKLKDSVLDKIVEYVPLKDRILKLRPVCRRLSSSVKGSVKSVEFLRDELDYCDDVKISFFLALYGKTVEHMNYDLFRSCSLREYTQWSWRQSVISSVTRCRQLKQLDILICCRHRLRDMDLQVIFKQCAELEVLRMDASFINGRCFANAPETLRKVELECCQTFTRQAFVAMCSRLSRLTTLHVSLLQTIDDYAIKKVSNMKCLKNLSIIANPEATPTSFRLAEICRIPLLETLCLDGLHNVTDKFLAELCNLETSPASRSLRHISFAFCTNIGSNGISKLKSLPKLVSLNLDGITKRDISIGLEAIGNAGRLERLLVSEDTYVSPKTIVDVVTKCESLRTLDISANYRLKDKSFAGQVYSARAFSFGKPMAILTDFKSMWRQLPPFSFQSRVEIVNVNDRYPEEFVDAISINSPQQLPRGHLIPDLRRGNRYKIVDFSLDTSTELLVDSPNFDQNVEIVNTDQDNAHQHIESENSEKMGNFDYYEQFNERRKFDLPDAPIIFDQQNQENLSPRGVGPLAVLTDKEQEELARALIGVQQPLNDADWFNYSSQDFPNMIQSASSTLCSNFEDSITVGTGGAPGPPKNTSSDKVLKHTRPSRPKRQAQKERAQQRRSGVSNNPTTSVPPGPSFTEEDFPPLG